MTKIRINDNYLTTVTRHADPTERWDADSTSQEHNIESVTVVGDNDYSDLAVGFDVEYDQLYYLLVVYYDTGDSFSRHENKISILDLYQSEEKAYENARSVDEQYRKNKSKYTVNLTREDGTKYKTHTDWVGYFESFKGAAVMLVTREN